MTALGDRAAPDDTEPKSSAARAQGWHAGTWKIAQQSDNGAPWGTRRSEGCHGPPLPSPYGDT
jgi:hypothetical protein